MHRLYGWEHPVLPALPAGEVAQPWPGRSEFDRQDVSPHPPQTAPGFTNAFRLGMLPAQAPLTPPQVVPGRMTADTWLKAGWGSVIAAFVSPFVTSGGGLGFVVFAFGIGFAFFAFARLAKVHQAERAAGYTSLNKNEGMWRLAADGRVVREPDRTVPPPGWYPSPYFPGLLQKWEGPTWSRLGEDWDDTPQDNFRWPARPLL